MAAFIVDLLCRDLMLEKEHVDELMMNTADYYMPFFMNGRRIDAPKLDLKYVQSWLLDFVRAETAELPDYVTAYEPGRSVVDNAIFHRYNQHMVTLDIKCFFKSCTSEMVSSFFSSVNVGEGAAAKGLSSDDVEALTALVTYRGSLPMGSPCSPAIANRIMAPVDVELIKTLGSGVTYTRYSDDICISSRDRIDIKHVVNLVKDTLARYHFDLNEKKIRCMGRGDARRVTGVFIEPDGTLSIGAKRKRELNAKLYRFLLYGEGCPAEIKGQLDFARSVNPRYVANLLLKYEGYGEAAHSGGVIGALSNAPA